MPVYDTKDPKVKRVRIHWKGRPIERRIGHESGKAVSLKEAEAYEARFRMQLEAGKRVEHRAVPTFSGFCSFPGDYYEYTHSADRLKSSTLRNRKYQIRTLIEFFGDDPLSEIDVARVLSYQSWRSAGDKTTKRRPSRGSTVNSDVQTLRAIIAYARKLGIPVQDIGAADRVPVRGEKRAKAWSVEQTERLLEAAWQESPDLFGIVLCMLNTGMRKGEALALRWSMIDLDEHLINLEGNEAWTPKDEEPREIPISDAFHEWLTTASREYAYVFASRKGERFAFWPQRKFDRAIKAAKLTGGAHSCRHTFASHFLAKNPDLDLLRRILGHSTVKVTEKVYGHMLPGRLAAARNVVNFGGSSTMIRTRALWRGPKK